jgi:hypothetical protein
MDFYRCFWLKSIRFTLIKRSYVKKFKIPRIILKNTIFFAFFQINPKIIIKNQLKWQKLFKFNQKQRFLKKKKKNFDQKNLLVGP